MFKAIYKFLASLKFAIILLSVIIVASAVGTVYETSFNADVAQKYVYGAWWFNIWLTALAVNLFCVAAIRYPWKRHQTGFVITHAGIITLLAGAMIDRLWGIEGYMHLHTTKAGTNFMELHAEKLRVTIDGQSAETKFKINTLWDALDLKSPTPDALVKIKHVLPVAAHEVAVPTEKGDEKGKPGINFTLQGPMMGRNDSSIFMDERDNLGPASVVFLAGFPKTMKSSLPVDDAAELLLHFQDKDFSFPLNPGETKSTPLDNMPGWKITIRGYYPNFIMNEKKEPDTRNNLPLNPAVCFELVGPDVKGWVPNATEVANAEHNTVFKQDPTRVAPSSEVFFVFSKTKDVMNTPKHGAPTDAKAALKVKSAGTGSSVISTSNGVAFYLGDDGKLRYLIKHTPRKRMQDDDEGMPTEKTGDVEFEKPVSVGWAPGAEFVVHELILGAKRKVIFAPKEASKGALAMEETNKGVLCSVTIGGASNEMWVGQTEVDNTFPQYLDVGGKRVNFEFVNQTVPIPFCVGLKEFKAPTDEGSNEFAAFESTLGFKNMECAVTLRKNFVLGTSQSDPTPIKPSQDYTDPVHFNKDGSVVLVGEWLSLYKRDLTRYSREPYLKRVTDFKLSDGRMILIKNDMVENVVFKNRESEQKISMNTPTTFPKSWYGPWLGTCYKFSQASHHITPNDPEHSDPNYSGVQVLRDPGWFLKWVGCIMINFGIFTMFYLRPYFNRPKVDPAQVAAAAAEAAEKESKKKKKK
ncbi:MAG: hypothetical protein WCT04_16060 [Planctomycetota bacterium]